MVTQRMMATIGNRTVFLILLGFAVGSLWRSFMLNSLPTEEWGSGFWQNFSTEMIGALVTFILFDQILGARQRAEVANRERNTRQVEKATQLRQAMSREQRQPVLDEMIALDLFHGATFVNINLDGADLEESNLENCQLKNVILSSANLEGATLTGSNLEQVNLVNANLSSADVSQAILRNAKLTNANLYNASFASANLEEATLKGANLYSASLAGANMRQVDCTNAILTEANLSDTRLEGADLQGVNLLQANLSGTNLAGANLKYALLGNSLLSGTNLCGADLSGSLLQEASLNNVQWADPKSGSAILPDGTVWENTIDIERFIIIAHPLYEETLGRINNIRLEAGEGLLGLYDEKQTWFTPLNGERLDEATMWERVNTRRRELGLRTGEQVRIRTFAS